MLHQLMEPARPRTVHGVSIGILMLDTGFARLPGDIGHGATWRFPVQYALMEGVTGPMVMAAAAGDRCAASPLIDHFVDAANRLARLGVDGVATSCGFLAAFQDEIAARCKVPVATSSLLQIPLAARVLPGNRRVGVLTAKSSALTAAHFVAVHADPTTPVAGLPDTSCFFQNQLNDAGRVSFDEQAQDVLDCAGRLLEQHPAVGAIVNECANFAPYSALIAESFGLPVFDVVSLVEWFYAGLRPRVFGKRIDDGASNV
ncbi:aspartate/glutamate racemase family protein [Caballeronia sp. AZ10_KS36]|uniref:aspartate/glutamate racemase family protein n=1 Tax=Caballeronia sp. AZ10_KS36 TaxID=2921757 RepID=UPI002027CBCF|nr:aspartate/glutamate racemase family protein [Caballeronia sp. AZ10_KS36]